MGRLRFWLNLIVLLLPLVLLGVGAVRLVRREFAYLNSDARLAGVLSVEATQRLGREVRVGNVRITGNLWGLSAANRIELFDVAVADGPTLRSGTLARADKVLVWYNLWQLLFVTDKRVPMIDALQLIGPQIRLARDAQGRWNFESLIAKKAPPARPFLDKISFSDGILYYSDARFPHPPGVPARPLVTRFDGLEGVALIRPDKSIAFDVAGVGQPALLRDFHAVGVAAMPPNRVQARLTANRVRLPFLAARFLPPAQGRVASGAADLILNALYTPEGDSPFRPFQFQALDTHGSVQIADLAASLPQVGVPLERVNGTATFTTDSLLTDLSGQVAGTGVAVKGSLFGLPQLLSRALKNSQIARLPGQAAPTVALQGSLSHLDLARLSADPRLPPSLKTQIARLRRQTGPLSGQANADFQIAGAVENPTATLTARFEGLRSPKVQIGNVEVRALLANRTLYADARARYARGDLSVRGQIALDKTGAYRVEAHGRNAQLDALGLALKQTLHGHGDLDLIAQGRRGELPHVAGQAQVHDIKLDNQTLNTLYAKVDTTGNRLNVRTLRLEDPKGFVLARGTVDLDKRRLNLMLEGDELDFGALSNTLSQPLRESRPTTPSPQEQGEGSVPIAGIGYVRGRVTGTLRNPLFRGRVSAFEIKAGKAALDTLEADLDLSRDALVISQGTVRRYPGIVRLSGVVAEPFARESSLNLTASADNLDVTDLLRSAGVDTKRLNLSGTLAADLRVTGTPRASQVVAENVSLQEATLADLPLEEASATVTYGPEGIRIREASVQVADGTISASGLLRLKGDSDLAVTATGLRLETPGLAKTLAQLLGSETLAERLEGQGTLRLKGEVALQAQVSGSLKAPAVALTLDTHQLALDTFTLGELHAALTYADKQLRSQNITLGDPQNPARTGGGIAVSRLTYDLDTKAVEAAIALRQLDLQKLRNLLESSLDPLAEPGKSLLAALNRLPDPLPGALSGSIAVAGTAESPVADLTWEARGLGQDARASFTGSARLTKNEAVLPSPRTPRQIPHFESGETYVDVPQAALAYQGPISGELNAYNVQLARVQSELNADLPGGPLRGAGDLFIVASGTFKSPVLDVSINLRDLLYHGQKIDRVDVAHATLTEGSLTADNITLLKRDTVAGEPVTYRARAHGTVDFTWSPPFVPPDATIDFEAAIPRQSLQLLSAFAPNVLDGSVGELSVTARVTGTRAAPVVSGSATVTASKMRFGTAATGLRDVDAAFAFRGDRLEVERFSARSQVYDRRTGAPLPNLTGSPIALTGSLPLGFGEPPGAGERGELRLRTVGENGSGAGRILFAESPLPGVTGGSARGTAEMDLQLTGTVANPTVAGTVTVHDAEATLPRDFGGVSAAGFALPVNPRFNLRLQLADNVRLVNPQLNARTTGSITLAGNLSAPSLQGTLTVHEGRLVLPTARFTILPPGTLRLLYPVYEANFGQPTLGIDVNIRAQTYLTATSVSGVRKRYQVIVTARGPLTGTITDPITGEPRLALTFQTDPPDLATSQQALAQRIAGSLVGMDAFNQLGRNPEQALAAQLTNVLTSSVLPGLFERPAEALGFEQFEINYDPVQHLNLTISRRLFALSRNLDVYATYIRSLGAGTEFFDVKFGLRYRDRYQLSYTFDEQNTQQILLEGVWQF